MKQFHSFRLDTVNQCLWRGEKRLPLTPKAFDLLRYLVEHADRLVTQDEMLEALWTATYVNQEVIKKHILEIRKVLGDRATQPTFIESVPRRGYRYVAPVKDIHPAVTSGSSSRTGSVMVGRARARVRLDRSLDRALAGTRQVIFVTGRRGSGRRPSSTCFSNTPRRGRGCGSRAASAWRASAARKRTTRHWRRSGSCFADAAALLSRRFSPGARRHGWPNSPHS
jgi:DNA-binding winged helix-turn-helix (wHTH) protein